MTNERQESKKRESIRKIKRVCSEIRKTTETQKRDAEDERHETKNKEREEEHWMSMKMKY